MEERPIEAVHGDLANVAVVFGDGGRADCVLFVAGARVLFDDGLLAPVAGERRGDVGQVSDAEDGLPAAAWLGVLVLGLSESETCGGEGASGPGVSNVGEVPFDDVGCCVSV